MSHILRPTAKSAAALFASRSSRCISTSLVHHSRHYAASWHVATQGRRYSTPPRKTSDPLHILFCGSDEFSCASLEALHEEHVRNPELIRSIDVAVRPGKMTGRGYKVIRDPPIRGKAENLGLPIHERDTFTGWNMPSKTNLIIAVSFGLFVPPRLLRGAKYGGLNLHPSLLPDLRGPAPLQHTLLSARTTTGVSLQTLDHANFDHGIVLSQTPSDSSALRIPESCRKVPDLQSLVTPIAAQMLIEGLRAGLHVPPLEDRGWKPDAEDLKALVHAPKITKTDRRLTSSLLRAEIGTLARRHAAIGPLWFESRDRHGRKKRIIIEAIEELPAEVLSRNRPAMLTESPSSSPSPSSSLSIDTPHLKQFLIPFEEEEEAKTTGADNDTPQAQRYLVFWDIPSLTQGKGKGKGEEKDELCLGNYRVLSLKVEGDRAKPARLALRNFVLGQ